MENLPTLTRCEEYTVCKIHQSIVCGTNPEDLTLDPRKMTRQDTPIEKSIHGIPYYINKVGTAIAYPDIVPEDDIKEYDSHLTDVHPENITLSENGSQQAGRTNLVIYISISNRLFYYNKNGVALYYYGHIPLEELPKCTCISHNF
jgi:hypothetical protein